MKFRPERPIFLGKENTSFRTKDEVLYAVQQLRDQGWLCVYSEETKPYHLSFNDPLICNEFQKCASDLGVKLKVPSISDEGIRDFDEKKNTIIKEEPESEDTNIHAGQEGAIIVDSDTVNAPVTGSDDPADQGTPTPDYPIPRSKKSK